VKKTSRIRNELVFIQNGFESGKKKTEGHFKDDELDGLWTEFDQNGEKWIETNYKNGKKEGLETKFHSNELKRLETNYKDGEQYGPQTEWEMNGVQKEVHQEKIKRFNVDIPETLHRAMKTKAAKHGLNLNTLTIELFTKYLQKKAK
jgi:predicted HicB family RNase H-like nuclease